MIDQKSLLDRIERNPEIMFGKPVIKGTRMPIDLILEKLAYGYSVEKIIEEYPFLTPDDIKSALLYASKSLSFEEEYSAV